MGHKELKQHVHGHWVSKSQQGLEQNTNKVTYPKLILSTHHPTSCLSRTGIPSAGSQVDAQGVLILHGKVRKVYKRSEFFVKVNMFQLKYWVFLSVRLLLFFYFSGNLFIFLFSNMFYNDIFQTSRNVEHNEYPYYPTPDTHTQVQSRLTFCRICSNQRELECL